MTRCVAKRIRYRTESLLLTVAVLAVPFQAHAHARSCSTGLTTKPMLFESALQYEDMKSKATPSIHVRINGKPAKMLLQSGSNMNVLWDKTLVEKASGSPPEKRDATVGAVQMVSAMLTDGHGNAVRQEFQVMEDSAFAQEGYAGIVSPQAIAGKNSVVMDFERNCLFASSPFDFGSNKTLRAGQASLIKNPHDVMAISVELDDREIPVVVGSGIVNTLIQESLVASKPKGEVSPRMMDINKQQVQKADYVRLVDMEIAGQVFKSLPVIPRQKNDNEGLPNAGSIGMDVLKDRIVYFNGARQEFFLATRQEAGK